MYIMNILISLFIYCAATIACASEYAIKQNSIHTVILKKDFTHCLSIYLSTKVGHLDNGVCHYEKETDRTENNILFCDSGMSISLNGDQLKTLVGSGYQCAATRLSDMYADPYSKTYALDEFLLISDNTGNYVMTQPAVGEATVHLDKKI